MKNRDIWQPSKFIFNPKKNNWVPNRDYVYPGSWFITKLLIKAYKSTLIKHCRGKLLDCGCGKVPFLGIYEPLVDRVDCIDWENSYHENSFIDFSVDLNKPLQIPDNSYDTILLADVLEHVFKPRELFSELNRILSPNGCLIIFVPFLYRIHEEPFDHYRYTEFTLRKFSAENDMKVLELFPYGGGVDVLFDLCHKIVSRKKVISKITTPLSLFFRKFHPLKFLNKKTEKTMPLGYVMVTRKP